MYYREYDQYCLGYSFHCAEAMDGANYYEKCPDLSLILDGVVYRFNDSSMIYMVTDKSDYYPDTLARNARLRSEGIDETGKVYQGVGSEPVPAYRDGGDTGSYDYYEFFTDASYGGYDLHPVGADLL